MALQVKVVEGSKAAENRCKRGWNLRRARIGKVRFASRLIAVDLGVEGIAEPPRRARDLDRLTARVDLRDAEAVRTQPALDLCHIRVRRPKLLPEGLGRQPLVIVRRARRVHLPNQLLQRRLLLVAALQHHLDPVQLHSIANRAAVVRLACEWVQRAR